MKTTAKKKSKSPVLFLAILVFLLGLLSAVQPTMARYTSSFDARMRFAPTGKGEPQLTLGEWTETGGGKALSLGVNAEGNVRVRLYIPAGEQPDIVFLHVGGKSYTAVLTPIPAGTAAYRTLGTGNVGCFYGEDGKELSLDASAAEVSATLAVMGSAVDTAGLRVLADPIKKS